MNKKILFGIVLTLAVSMMGMGIYCSNAWEVLAGFWQLMWAIEKMPSDNN